MSQDSGKVLVVPTCRPGVALNFYRHWKRAGFDMILFVCDAPHPFEELQALSKAKEPTQVWCVSWVDIDAIDQRKVFSRRDSAIRSYGFWWAWMMAKAKVIFTLDDDCLPSDIEDPGYFICEHMKNLTATPMWTSSVPGLRVRGLPYRNLGKSEPAFSMGLWHNVPDLDAPTALVKGVQGLSAEKLEKIGTRVMPSTQYFPFCGMNFAFTREMTPLCYFPPMGEGLPYGRFDDIWAGLVIQKVCRVLVRGITVGKPYVNHTKVSDTFVNLVKEAPGIRDNEVMWEVIEAAPIDSCDPLTCMEQMADYLLKYRPGELEVTPELVEYIHYWGEKMGLWLQLFR